MKLGKKMGELLYDLFGPNGSDQMVTTGPHGGKIRMAACRELERHGIVKLEKSDKWECLWNVRRVITSNKTLVELSQSGKL